MALWFAGSICSLLAHCVGTGSILVLPLGYDFLALMGGGAWGGGIGRGRRGKEQESDGEVEGKWWGRGKEWEENRGAKGKVEIIQMERNSFKQEEVKKQCGKNRKRKMMRNVVTSSHPSPSRCLRQRWGTEEQEERADTAFPQCLKWQCHAGAHPLANRLSPRLNFIIKLTESLLGVWADSCIEFWFIVWFIRAVDGRLDDLVLQKYLGMQRTAISALLITIIIKINVPPQSIRWLCHSI